MTARDEEFTRYVETRSAALLRTAVFLCSGDSAAAEDLVQATLVKAYVHWSRVRDEHKRDAYVRKIMVRESYRRGPARAKDVAHVAEIRDRASPAGDHDDHLSLFPQLAALPRQQRAVVVLRYYEDLSEQQIADALGCSTGSVKQHASRGLATLRERLHDTYRAPAEGADVERR
ncbi:SigE family RNA polymerase sigma factor [Nocardioides sp.]|uniref:SigE family RNA polymerase sigma factor n=1 Tax=Nocardioides sp. TaxID=35761 RepID=UPI002C7D3E1F|nr:SigE family RNA polymerase sigma factor [Nocardioides sp.]HXH80132.1 SigE family RNA polymerase sigma factor [Nocardioides sp.]